MSQRSWKLELSLPCICLSVVNENNLHAAHIKIDRPEVSTHKNVALRGIPFASIPNATTIIDKNIYQRGHAPLVPQEFEQVCL